MASIGWFLLALVLLALGGDSVVKGAAGLARRFGWPTFTVGLVLVALATSIPELVVNFRAVAVGQEELALGNAVGSNIVNVGLTLAFAAIAAPLVVRWRSLAHLLVVLLGYGAWLLVRHAPAVGLAMGLTPLVTGLLPIAIGTALPEMAGAIGAARRGQGDLVAGHVIGSSLVNILLVLGGMALLSDGLSVPASFVRYELPAAFVFGALMLPVLRGDMRVSRNEGIVLGIALAGWIVFEILLLRG